MNILLKTLIGNIRSGLTFLRFPGDSENAFLHYYYRRTIGQTRFALIAGIFLYGSITFIDPYIVPNIVKQVQGLRFFIVLPMLFGSFLMTYVIKKDAIAQILTSITVTAAGFCVAIMMSLDPGLGSQIYHEGLVLTIIYGYTFMRLRLWHASVCGWSIVIFYLIIAVSVGKTPVPVLVNNVLFNVISNVIGMFVAYTLEVGLRSEYLSAMAMKRTHKGLQKLSLFDDLTGVANRRLLELRLSSEFQELERRGRSLSFIITDIDYFKAYNDNFGHPAGDECLVKVAKKLQQCATRAGDLAARYGGEEFAVILSDTPLAGALIVAEKIRQEIKDMGMPLSPLGGGVVTLSLGVATILPSRQNSIADLIKAADDALYRAKNNGRDRVEYAQGAIKEGA